jgi:serine phosphatase RsbU (regulator of sigma subunit)
VIAAADCTGHGVPGALMSMLGVAFLNEIIRRKEVVKSSQVLDILREEVKLALGQSGRLDDQRDGMDITFCIINTKTNILQFAGANNPMYIIRKSNELEELNKFEENDIIRHKKNTLIQLRADRQPISVFLREEPFTNHEIKLHKGDKIYMFSDGYQDQFGGVDGKKFMTKNLKKLFLDICDKPMLEQKEILDSTFEKWKGNNNKQIDDVLVIGLQIPS